MIKLVYCLVRRADLPPDEFYRSWLNDHAALVKTVASDIGAVRYVQSHTCLAPTNLALKAARGLGEPFDGITELWWNSEADFLAHMATPASLAAAQRLQQDEARFIDFSRSSIFMTTEHPIY